MFSLENDHLTIEVRARGAELTRIFSKTTGLEYLWEGDPAYWGKHSPVLFPIVGTLKNGTYFFENKAYKLSRHGFARDMDFELAARDERSLTFALSSNDYTLAHFPFGFRLEVVYSLQDNTLQVDYHVLNTGKREMYFSIGGHPAFRVPLTPGTAFEDYFLEFAERETAGRWPISHEGLIEPLPIGLLTDTRTLPLTRELFSNDAIVFKYLNSHALSLRSHSAPNGIHFQFDGFPFLGIWSGNGGNFVCLEPWCGIADSVAATQQLIGKEGINMITPEQTFRRSWQASLF